MTPGSTALVGRTAIVHDVRALGLPRGETYLVHSSLSHVGALLDGPRTLVDALRGACGPRATIAVPTFTAGNSTTTRAYLRRTAGMTREQLRAEEATIPGFDVGVTPSQNVGVVAEYLRTAPGSLRSDHPQTSFGANGPRAAELVEVHELDCHLGDESPLGRLYAHDAVVVLIGVGFDVCTCFHLAEYRLDEPPPMRRYRTFVTNDGRRELRQFLAPDTDDRDFARIGDEMAMEPFVHRGRIGRASVHWFRLRAAVDFAVGWMNRVR